MKVLLKTLKWFNLNFLKAVYMRNLNLMSFTENIVTTEKGIAAVPTAGTCLEELLENFDFSSEMRFWDCQNHKAWHQRSWLSLCSYELVFQQPFRGSYLLKPEIAGEMEPTPMRNDAVLSDCTTRSLESDVVLNPTEGRVHLLALQPMSILLNQNLS